MIARSTEPAADCRFSRKVAVPDAGATEFCALGRVDETRVANADCHFPSPRGEARAVDHDSRRAWRRHLSVKRRDLPAESH